MKKRLLSIAVSVMLLLTMMPFCAFPVSAAQDGVFTYYIEDGEARIEACDTGVIGALEIPATLGGVPVTEIGTWAFEDCTGLTAITIPDSVVEISAGAFVGCSALETINIGNGVEYISDSVFSETAYYQNANNWVDDVLYIGNYLIKAKETLTGSYEVQTGTRCIARYAFNNCSDLTKVTFPESLVSINDGAFNWCDTLESVAMSDGVKTIGDSAFNGCYSLAEVTLGSGLTTIGSGAFYNCEALESIELPAGLKEIGSYAFAYSGLTSVTIPASVEYLDSDSFYECEALTGISVEGDNLYYASHEGVLYDKEYYFLFLCPAGKTGEYTVREETAGIAGSAFYLADVTKVTIPAGVNDIGFAAFDECYDLTAINVSADNASYASHEGVLYNKTFTELIWCPEGKTGSYAVLPGTLSINSSAFMHCVKLTDVTIPGSVRKIWDTAFYGCTALESVSIGNGVEEIYNSAFASCYSLTSITIPDSVKSIRYSAFEGCIELDAITLGAGIEELGESVFNDTAYYYDEANWEDNVLYCGNYLLEADDVSGAYTVKVGTTCIADDAFEYEDLESVVLPNSVKYIGDYAFYSCDALASISLGNAVERVGEDAFAYSSYFENEENWDADGALYIGSALIAVDNSITGAYTVKTGTTCIADYALYYCDEITKVTLPAGMLGIGKYAFYECEMMEEAAIPNTVRFIDDYAFSECAALKEIRIPDSVQYIGESAFEYCLIANPIIIGTGVTVIDDWAFSDCDGVETIIVPGNVKFLGEGAISYNDALTSITVQNGLKILWKSVFCDNDVLESVSIPNSVVVIDSSAFSSCYALDSIVIPDSVKYIGSYAFGWSGLKEITLGTGVETIAALAFEVCDELTKVWYGGSAEDRAEINIDPIGNDDLLDADWYYNNFADVASSHWALKGILYCYKNGIISGGGDGNFNPSGTMNRAALVTMFYQLEGAPEVSGSAGFTDVNSDAWYANAVAWASQNGIVNGKGDGRFAPTEPVTRASYVTILYNYAVYCGRDVDARADLSGFADAASVPGWASDYFEWAVAEGLISGTTSGGAVYVNPTGKATRAQGAVLMQKFCEM